MLDVGEYNLAHLINTSQSKLFGLGFDLRHARVRLSEFHLRNDSDLFDM